MRRNLLRQVLLKVPLLLQRLFLPHHFYLVMHCCSIACIKLFILINTSYHNLLKPVLSITTAFVVGLSISSQPKDIVVVYGQEAKLEVRSDTLGQMCTYQWYKDGRKLLGRTQKSMIIASAVDSDEGSYTCLVSNADGSVLSHPATITVVSVQPRSLESSQPLKYTAAGIPKKNRRREQYASSDPAVYGLTGRGVDDNIVNHYKFQSKPAAISSLSKGIQQIGCSYNI